MGYRAGETKRKQVENKAKTKQYNCGRARIEAVFEGVLVALGSAALARGGWVLGVERHGCTSVRRVNRREECPPLDI